MERSEKCRSSRVTATELLGICFLREVVESIVQGGDRGLRGKEGRVNAEL